MHTLELESGDKKVRYYSNWYASFHSIQPKQINHYEENVYIPGSIPSVFGES
jgi:hypothetical protein